MAAIDLVCPWPGCSGLAYMFSRNTERRRFRCERCERRFTIQAADYRSGLEAAGWVDPESDLSRGAEAEPQTATARVHTDSHYFD
jgi:hypothetical protein